MFTRIKRAWAVLTNKIVASERIYVYPSEHNPNKFVQLMYFRDDILALDAEGKIWIIKSDYGGFSQYQQWMESPPRRY